MREKQKRYFRRAFETEKKFAHGMTETLSKHIACLAQVLKLMKEHLHLRIH